MYHLEVKIRATDERGRPVYLWQALHPNHDPRPYVFTYAEAQRWGKAEPRTTRIVEVKS